MNDDEMIERLRASLHERADALHIAPGRLPAPGGPAADEERAIWGPEAADAGAPTTVMAADAGAAGDDGPRTAEYALSPPTGAVPIIGNSRRRWVAGGVAVLAAAAAIALAVILPGRSHPVSVPPIDRTSNPTTAVSTPTSVAVSPTTVPSSAVTRPAVTSGAVPAVFIPESVTFVSADDGWVLGSATCSSSSSCAVLAQTTDGGRTWKVDGVPSGGGTNVRFANAEVGWIWTSGGPTASLLYRTTDGGRVWQSEANPFPGSTIADLEVSGGFAQIVADGACTAGTVGCQGQTVEELFSSPVNGSKWTTATYQPPIGAGPVLDPQLTLWGTTGWLVNVNRTTVSGARLVDGTWEAWTPPCSNANGAATLAASSADDLAAVCSEGQLGTPDPGTKANTDWLWTSTDGGSTFRAVGEVPGAMGEAPVSAAPDNPATIAVASGGPDAGDGLMMSFDSGATWTFANPGPAGNVDFVGFTTSAQAVALVAPHNMAMFMTYNGGHTWLQVQF